MTRLVSGIQPTGTGVPHLGNYLGAIRPLVKLAPSYSKAFVFVADIHATTVAYNPRSLFRSSLMTMKALMASGVPESCLFMQSRVHEHYQLGLMLQHLTTINQLSHLTQFRDKSGKTESVETGLLTYPALMTADIMLYSLGMKVDVIVGEDQTQHIEFANDLIRKFNRVHGCRFFKIGCVMGTARRVMSLQDPTRKMSKSDLSEMGIVYLTDDMDYVSRKFRRAVTGSKPEIVEIPEDNEAGTLNLLNILSGMTDMDIASTCQSMAGRQMSYLKKSIIECYENTVAPVGIRMKEITDDAAMNVSGEVHAQITARQTMSYILHQM